MCLTIPKQVISVKKGFAKVKSTKGEQTVGAIVKIKKGDWVLTQNNVVVRKISQKDAREISALFNKAACAPAFVESMADKKKLRRLKEGKK